MSSNTALSNRPELKDIIFSEDEILANVDDTKHVFGISTKLGEELGYVSYTDLKNYLATHEGQLTEYLICPYGQREWITVFESPLFQRRKPQLVPASSLAFSSDDDDNLSFFILRHGQKNGPYQKSELNLMIEKKELLLTDMVSHDGGHNWCKMYQDENFDRRVLKESDQLPGIPKQVIALSLGETKTERPETDALSSLAYLSNVKRGKSIEREKIEFFEEEMTKKAGSSGVYKWLLIASVLGIGYFLFHIKNQLLSPFEESTPAIGEQAEMLTPVNIETDPAMNRMPSPNSQVNDQRRSGAKFETRHLNPIRPMRQQGRKSFMDTPKYQEIESSNHPETPAEDGNYFYDNASPMELDPVRSQVSKENFDNPEEGPIPSSDTLFESETPN